MRLHRNGSFLRIATAHVPQCRRIYHVCFSFNPRNCSVVCECVSCLRVRTRGRSCAICAAFGAAPKLILVHPTNVKIMFRILGLQRKRLFASPTMRALLALRERGTLRGPSISAIPILLFQLRSHSISPADIKFGPRAQTSSEELFPMAHVTVSISLLVRYSLCNICCHSFIFHIWVA
jgi:hypothetical protein